MTPQAPDISLPAQLFLLALDSRGGFATDRVFLELGLVTAGIYELLIRGSAVRRGALLATAGYPYGADEIAVHTWRTLSGAGGQSLGFSDAVELAFRSRSQPVEAASNALSSVGILSVDAQRRLGLFQRKRFHLLDEVPRAQAQKLALDGFAAEMPPARTWALCALVDIARLTRAVIPKDSRQQVHDLLGVRAQLDPLHAAAARIAARLSRPTE